MKRNILLYLFILAGLVGHIAGAQDTFEMPMDIGLDAGFKLAPDQPAGFLGVSGNQGAKFDCNLETTKRILRTLNPENPGSVSAIPSKLSCQAWTDIWRACGGEAKGGNFPYRMLDEIPAFELSQHPERAFEPRRGVCAVELDPSTFDRFARTPWKYRTFSMPWVTDFVLNFGPGVLLADFNKAKVVWAEALEDVTIVRPTERDLTDTWLDVMRQGVNRAAYLMELHHPEVVSGGRDSSAYAEAERLGRLIAGRPNPNAYWAERPEASTPPIEPPSPEAPPLDPVEPPPVEPSPSDPPPGMDDAWTFIPTTSLPRLSRPIGTPGDVTVHLSGLLAFTGAAKSAGWGRSDNSGIMWLTEAGWPPDWRKVGAFVIYRPRTGNLCLRVGKGQRNPGKKCFDLVRRREADVTDEMDFRVVTGPRSTTLTISNAPGVIVATLTLDNGGLPAPTWAYYGHGCGPSDGCRDFRKPLKVGEEVDENLRIALGVTYSGAGSP